MRCAILALVIVSLSVNTTLAQPAASERPSIRVRLTGSSGERVTGRARAIRDGVLELARDGEDGEITLIQLDSIALIERGSRRAPRALATAAGFGVGVLGFFASLFGALGTCSDEHTEGTCWGVFEGMMWVGAPVVGSLFGWYLGRTNWRRITADDLQKALPPTLP